MSLDRRRPPSVADVARDQRQTILDLHQRRQPRVTQRDTLVNPSSLSTLPKAWCGRDTATLSPGDTLSVDVTISASDSQVLVIATAVVENTSGSANTVDLTGYFRSAGSSLNDHVAARDKGWSWPTDAQRTITAACLIDSGSSAGFQLQLSGGSTGDVDVALSVDVVEVDGQTSSCCFQGG